MEKKKTYYVPDLKIFGFEADSGFAASAEVNCNNNIQTWEAGDDNWFN